MPGSLLTVAAMMVTTMAWADGVARNAGEDHWLEVRLSGAPTGYQHERVTAQADGGWRTEQASSLVLNRMESRVEIRSSADLREDARGHLRSATAESGSSAETTTFSAEVVDGVFRLSTHAGDRAYVTETALEQPLLGPQGVREQSRLALRQVGDRIEYRSFAGEYGALVTVLREVVGLEAIQLNGQALDTVRVRETLDVMPVPSQLWLDADGRVLRQQQGSPFGLVEAVRTGADVRERTAGGAELPDDTYSNAVAKSNIRLPQPRSLEQVTVRIELKREDSAMPVLDGPDQVVLERGDRHAVVQVRRGDTPDTGVGAPNAEVDGSAWLQANAWLQSDHPDIVALADSLRRPELDRYAQARVLQDWVTANMSFDAGIAMVSASEAVRDRRGTCVAYAVLLTTLSRALDIPSRVVLGYVYAANMWGGHAWTEVLVDGRWVALDAAVWRAGPADAARIGVVRTSLEQGSASGLAELAQLYGNERVRVLDYTLDGQTRLVPADAMPYQAKGRHYRNDWLGIAFDLPPGYDFAETDIMYPRSEVVVLRNVEGASITVAQRSLHAGEAADLLPLLRDEEFQAAPQSLKVGSRQAWLAADDDSARVVWQDDSDLWSVAGDGADVEAAIRELLRSFRASPATASPGNSG